MVLSKVSLASSLCFSLADFDLWLYKGGGGETLGASWDLAEAFGISGSIERGLYAVEQD